MAAQFTTLADVENSVRSCARCFPSLADANEVKVLWAGNTNASLAVVGKYSAREEIRRGEPFAGASGKLLFSALKEIGYSREDVFLTNAVKCFVEKLPKGMISKCREFLRAELAVVCPRLIILMGEEAYNGFFGGSAPGIPGSFSSIRWIPFSVEYTSAKFGEVSHRTVVIVTMHPAYHLRIGTEKEFVELFVEHIGPLIGKLGLPMLGTQVAQVTHFD